MCRDRVQPGHTQSRLRSRLQMRRVRIRSSTKPFVSIIGQAMSLLSYPFVDSRLHRTASKTAGRMISRRVKHQRTRFQRHPAVHDKTCLLRARDCGRARSGDVGASRIWRADQFCLSTSRMGVDQHLSAKCMRRDRLRMAPVDAPLICIHVRMQALCTLMCCCLQTASCANIAVLRVLPAHRQAGRCSHQIQCPRAAFPDTGEYSAIIGVIAGVLPGPVSLGAPRLVAFFIAEAHAMVWWVQWGPIVS